MHQLSQKLQRLSRLPRRWGKLSQRSCQANALRCAAAINVFPGKGAYGRIYHVHIRKTAGTSVNAAFLGCKGHDQKDTFLRLHESRPHAVNLGGFVVAGWDNDLIRSSYFHYAFSHIPLPNLAFGNDVFKFTIIRDPFERYMSYFKMLRDYLYTGHWSQTGKPHADLARESCAANLGPIGCLAAANAPHVLSHLYMFSPNFDLTEGVENASRLNAIYDSKHLTVCVDDMMQRFGVNLALRNHNRSITDVEVNVGEKDAILAALKPEYDFIDRLRVLPNFRG